MGLITAGRLPGMTIIVLTSLNVLEIMFGMISLMEMARDRPDPFQYQADAEFHGPGGAGRAEHTFGRSTPESHLQVRIVWRIHTFCRPLME